MAAPKGHPRWGGRKPGGSNKATVQAKEAIQLAFDRLGGVDALVKWAESSEDRLDIFYGRVYPRILPHEVTGPKGGPIQFEDMTLEERAARARRLKGILDAASAD